MNLQLALEPHDYLVVHLREGDERTSVSVPQARAGVSSLSRALQEAIAHGYGECFWPGVPGGQYWWIFKRDGATLETAVMWTRGGASLWEHVFRATDAAEHVRSRLREEADRLKLDGGAGLLPPHGFGGPP